MGAPRLWTPEEKRERQARRSRANYAAREMYDRIMAGAPTCAYCTRSATTVDHLWPFDLYGAETDANLVPACATCNCSKGNSSLAEWPQERHLGRLAVAYGAAHSPKVAAELARLEAAA
jgi:5-methylcytosine-specific restriction endonuclease McrA